MFNRCQNQIGRALVSTHDYRRAVDYYRKALRGQPTSIPLRHDLARLCLKLGRFNDASGVLGEVRRFGGHVLRVVPMEMVYNGLVYSILVPRFDELEPQCFAPPGRP